MVEREQILEGILRHAEVLDWFFACWEGGSAANQRVDCFSDVDLRFVVSDGRVEEAFSIIEQWLEALSPITHKCRMPEPTWHGHSHCFYQLERSPDYLFIDVVVMKKSSEYRHTESNRHGNPIVYFDKERLVSSEPIDNKHNMVDRRDFLVRYFPFAKQSLLKAIYRNRPIDAFDFYHNILKMLVEIWGMRYRPARFDFGLRYTFQDFPAEIQEALAQLCYPSGMDVLRNNLERVENLFFMEVGRNFLEE